jgi:hypothetical protein
MAAYNAIMNALELNPSIIADMAAEFPVERRNVRPAPEKWSALEHLAHLARIGPFMNVRLRDMLENPSKPVVPYNPEDDPTAMLSKADWDKALNQYQWERAALVGTLRDVSMMIWEREVEHPEYNTYSIRIMARHLALHDLLHGSRIESLLLEEKKK